MYLTESFKSSELQELFNSKDALNIFKKYIVGKFDVSWGSISDDDISVYNIRDCVWDFMYTNDYDELCKTVLLTDTQSVVLYTSEKNIIEYVGYHMSSDYNAFDDNMDDDIDIMSKLLGARCNIDDIKNYLYIRGDKVDCRKTFYKMLLLDNWFFEYSLKHKISKYSNDYIEFGMVVHSRIGKTKGILELLCPRIDCVKVTADDTDTKFIINIKNKKYFFDFDVTGLSDDEFDNRINLYADYLYEIDTERRIKSYFNLTFADVLFQFVKKHNKHYVYRESFDYDYISLFNFAPLQLYCKKDFRYSNKPGIHQNVRMFFVIMKHLLSNNKEMYKYNINVNRVEHHKLIRSRQLNKIRGIDVDKSISDESYVLAKEMFKYLWEFKDDIYKFSKKLGSDGNYVLKAYNDLLVIDNKVMEMSKKSDNPDFVKKVYDDLQGRVEEFIDLVGEMIKKKEYVPEFTNLACNIIILYHKVMGEHNVAEFYN